MTKAQYPLRAQIVELLTAEKKEFEKRYADGILNPFTRKSMTMEELCHPFPDGVSARKVTDFSKRTGVKLPGSLQEWLRITNGAAGYYGIGVKKDLQDIEKLWERFPHWKERRWIPVAYDDFGNYYVQPGSDAVCFVESLSSDELAYVAASDMMRFVLFRLEELQGVHEAWRQQQLRKRSLSPAAKRALQHPNPWPFHKEYTLMRDPDIKRIAGLPLPWH